MIRGITFDKQLMKSKDHAHEVNYYYGGDLGITKGCEVTENVDGNLVVSEGYFIINGRLVGIEGSEIITVPSVPSGTLYSILVFEINLNQENTLTEFNQGIFKIISDATNYPTLIEQDLDEGGTVYQFEFARFMNTVGGISELVDTRKLFDNRKYAEVSADIKNIEEEIEDSHLYLASGFTATSETLNLWTSRNGEKWEHIGRVYTPSSEKVRDPSIAKHNGKYYAVYTTGFTNNYFALASSFDLVNWEFMSNITIHATYDKAWAPEIFIDTDGTFHIFVSCSLSGTSTFKICETHATNVDLTTWSTFVQVTGDFPVNVIDPFVVKKENTYYLWYKNEDTKHLEYASSSVLTSGYLVQESGDWAGWGSGFEGVCLILLPNGSWRIYFDDYLNSNYYYSDSSDDWATWASKQLAETDEPMRHLTVKKETDYSVDIWYAINLNNKKRLDKLDKAPVISDANALIDKGTYTYDPNTLNIPLADYGIIDVLLGDEGRWIFQISISVNGVVKRRRKINTGAWSAWA